MKKFKLNEALTPDQLEEYDYCLSRLPADVCEKFIAICDSMSNRFGIDETQSLPLICLEYFGTIDENGLEGEQLEQFNNQIIDTSVEQYIESLLQNYENEDNLVNSFSNAIDERNANRPCIGGVDDIDNFDGLED